jgi:hypothetical protein
MNLLGAITLVWLGLGLIVTLYLLVLGVTNYLKNIQGCGSWFVTLWKCGLETTCSPNCLQFLNIAQAGASLEHTRAYTLCQTDSPWKRKLLPPTFYICWQTTLKICSFSASIDQTIILSAKYFWIEDVLVAHLSCIALAIWTTLTTWTQVFHLHSMSKKNNSLTCHDTLSSFYKV